MKTSTKVKTIPKMKMTLNMMATLRNEDSFNNEGNLNNGDNLLGDSRMFSGYFKEISMIIKSKFQACLKEANVSEASAFVQKW